ncbi:MAG: hypothetical protein PHG54_08210 [Smithellaceae bacterium]|nr:hypothetical protein [Syntrophaceae bacterium]MDD4241402.1 hypothetical protein [Smithellaceae bacterium]
MTLHKNHFSMTVIAASFLGPSLTPNEDMPWREDDLPQDCDELVQKTLGQPMRRAGRFIKMVCSGAAACLQKVPAELLAGKKTGIFLATGLGNGDEILPFITQVFLHDGGFPRPNQFANSVSNAAAFFLARQCGIKGVILTLSDEELSFESALWLAESYLAAGDIDLALVGGCDVYTPTVDEYRDRMNAHADNARALPIGEGSSWLLLGAPEMDGPGEIFAVEIGSDAVRPDAYIQSAAFAEQLSGLLETAAGPLARRAQNRLLLPGFRVRDAREAAGGPGLLALHDYLPHCGIHPTAAAFGLARALVQAPSSVLFHFNSSATGKPALVAAATK